MQVKLDQVSKFFGNPGQEIKVLDNISFCFPESHSVAVLGPSGVGKTTLLNLIGGLERPTAGTIVIGKEDITSLSEDNLASFRGNRIGFVFQFHHLLSEFSAVENVAMPLLIGGAAKQAALDQAEQVLKRVGLNDRLLQRPGKLSGGEQQRVSIARAIVARPDIILADEPTGNLDSRNSEAISELLVELQKETDCTLIVVTHSHELAKKLDIRVEMASGGHLNVV